MEQKDIKEQLTEFAEVAVETAKMLTDFALTEGQELLTSAFNSLKQHINEFDDLKPTNKSEEDK